MTPDPKHAPFPPGANGYADANLYPPRQGAKSERLGRRSTFTEVQIADAIRAGAGIFAETCRALKAAHGRGISVSTLGRIVNSSENLQKVLREVTEARLDYCESQLWRKIEAGDNSSLQFYLRCKGASRGWQPTLKHSGDRENPIRNVVQFDFQNMSIDDLRQLQTTLAAARVSSPVADEGDAP